MANEAAKMARKKQLQQDHAHQNSYAGSSTNTSGVLDKIEEMLEQGKYRPDGTQRTGYRVRRKGQPTVYVCKLLY